VLDVLARLVELRRVRPRLLPPGRHDTLHDHQDDEGSQAHAGGSVHGDYFLPYRKADVLVGLIGGLGPRHERSVLNAGTINA
jgi:hypothetical protein